MTATSLEIPNPPQPGQKAFRIETDGDLAVLWFDLPGEKINKFSTWVIQELDGVLDRIAAMPDVKRVVVASKKPGIFIAGADIVEFTQVKDAAQAEAYVKFGQSVMTKLSRLPQITVAAINGACMGGGTELALNCDYRVISDSRKASIALPETKLGIIPAWTGTTRLPRLVGLTTALDMILTGKSLDGRRAKSAGLVDEVAPDAILLDAAKTFVSKQTRKRKGSDKTHFYVEGNPLARNFIFNQARKGVLAKTAGRYPAVLKAIDVMQTGYSKGYEAGLAAEAREAAQLSVGEVAKNLINLFFMMEGSKKDPTKAAPRPVEFAGVLGAGVMGGGIAQIISDKAGIDVRMRDINWNALAGGMKAAAKVWKKKVERRRMKPNEMARKLARITTTTDWSGFSRAAVVVEAVVENLDVKQQVLKEFEEISNHEAIFATNTSTIPIGQIAANAQRPGNVVGMHFFNPVDKMPLVEVIRGPKSSDAAVNTVAAFARKLGKTVVHVKDAPGFVVNRILAPYMNEAAFLLEEGNSIESLDKAMVDFGMPMGPMALLDEVGIDVAAKAGKIMHESFGERMTPAKSLPKLIEDGRLGKKNGKGMYLWKDGKRGGADPAIYKLTGITPKQGANYSAVAERMVLAMINEAALILEEKVVASAAELDLAMIMGTGFPPFRGGLARYADTLGLPYIMARLSDLEAKAGPRFAPSAPLKRLAETGGAFYGAYPAK